MPFKYSCFISYRHQQGKLARRIINDLYTALSNEVELLTDKEIFVDWQRLEAGYLLDKSLARELCQSVCMIVVYTPTYFDIEHNYCAREYKAMVGLEKERLDQLGQQGDDIYGLIIPIVFRGEKSLPDELKQRLYLNFETFTLYEAEMIENPVYAPEIRKLAEYIAGRCQVFDRFPQDLTVNCAKFTLPSMQQIKDWLKKLQAVPAPFPGREGDQ